MMTLANVEVNVWVPVAALVFGYIAGHLVPLSKIAGWIPGKKD